VVSKPGQLRTLEQVVRRLSPITPAAPLLAAARTRAEALGSAAGDGLTPLAAATFVADVVAGLWVEGGWTRDSVEAIVERAGEAAAETHDAMRMSVFVRAIRSEYLYELPPKLGIEAQLQMLAAFARVLEATLWTLDDGHPRPLLHVGDGEPSRRSRAVAQQAIVTGHAVTGRRTQLHALPVRRWDRAEAAIVIRTSAEGRAEAVAYASECALAIGPLLEIENVLARNATRERSLVDSTERQLARLGLDLHDGPMQDIAAVAQDLRLFRTQLSPFLEGLQEEQILLGRLDDLEGHLLSMDGELRELARSLQAPTTLQTPFVDLLRRDVERFEQRTAVRVKLTSTGDLRGLTSSQKIALLRVINEALNNVQEHSGVRSASVRVSGTRTHLTALVSDEGAGFDVEPGLIRAAKSGRLGLVGMSERVRLLHGRLDVESAPGGPTHVRATIPRWRPLRTPED
jgi:signal transduction histidine kinase